MKFIAAIVLFAGACLASCSRYEEIYTVRFRSIGREILAVGKIKLDMPLTAQGKTRAAYHLQMQQVESKDEEVIWFYRLFRNKEDGEAVWLIQPEDANHPRYNFDFMPGLQDASIIAETTSLKDGKAKGKWSYGIYSGGYTGGEFEIEKK